MAEKQEEVGAQWTSEVSSILSEQQWNSLSHAHPRHCLGIAHR